LLFIRTDKFTLGHIWFTPPLTLGIILFSKLVYANDCAPTAHRTTGTHYEPVSEQRKDIGKGIIVSGQVLSIPDCQPVANAKVAHWQAGENGRYQDELRAYLFTDKQGRYQFETEWPNISPPHIHFIVTARLPGT
jgi:protocatechuate 3,4-dioxygenase beta subunit